MAKMSKISSKLAPQLAALCIDHRFLAGYVGPVRMSCHGSPPTRVLARRPASARVCQRGLRVASCTEWLLPDAA